MPERAIGAAHKGVQTAGASSDHARVGAGHTAHGVPGAPATAIPRAMPETVVVGSGDNDVQPGRPPRGGRGRRGGNTTHTVPYAPRGPVERAVPRSEEHTSELQSPMYL